jgi:hypothetical protein
MARTKAIAALAILLLLWRGRDVVAAGKKLLGEEMPTGPSPESHQRTLDRAATTITMAEDTSKGVPLSIGTRTKTTWAVPDNIQQAAAISGMTVEEWLAEQGA